MAPPRSRNGTVHRRSSRAASINGHGNGNGNGKHAAATNGMAALAPVRPTTVSRKADHIRINVEEDVAAKGVSAGFDQYRFRHRALPEIDLASVDTGRQLFGRSIGSPILISCMTGGTEEARGINLALAAVAQEFRLPMGLGSGRVLLEHPDRLPTFAVRPAAPDIPLLVNLGAVQLNKGVGVDGCRRLVDLLEADALVLHLNPLQEALQPEGDTTFADLLPKIGRLCRELEHPVVVKEVGWGIGADDARALLDAGVAAIDVAGAGGTSWSEVERHRMDEAWRARAAAAFAGWGIPTTEALRAVRRAAPDALVFASGGVRDGVDVAKALALGADVVGLAGPFLRAAAAGGDEAHDLALELTETLRIAMFAAGAGTLDELRTTDRLDGPPEPGPRTHVTTLEIQTGEALEFIDLTDRINEAVARSGIREGIAHVFSHHTTAAIRINENEPLLMTDFRRLLERLVPQGGFEHDDLSRRVGVPPDEPLNGHAHCRHLLLSSSESIPIVNGDLGLGQWQRLFLIELCSARQRRITVQVVGR